ncbi:MAG: BCD family MFS transporter [Hyphomicrobium aestuarii]|nr:BCD family MFS transporter [Hyphomicrobium aestuarii]
MMRLVRRLSNLNARAARTWTHIDPRWLPFADAATPELPMSRLLRLSLFQVTVGMAATLVIGTLNRVMIVELGVAAWIVGIMVALPLLLAPARALIGHRSDGYISVIGWRRVPYLMTGTMLQYGGLSFMPFALIVLADGSDGPQWLGPAAAAFAFLMVGAGLHMVQTCGLALATDLAPAHARPKVVALMCTMLLVGMVASSALFGALLADFSYNRLVQVIQGAALATFVLNAIAIWKQEPRRPQLTAPDRVRPSFRQSWRTFAMSGRAKRRLFALALGTAAFSMQDVLLEPYGGQILKLSVAQTTALTAVFASGGIAGLVIAARLLGGGADPYRVAAYGVLIGLVAFGNVIFAAPLSSPALFTVGVALIGLGGGLFGHATLTAAMDACRDDDTGFALGIWGAVQSSAAGLAIATGGIVRDVVGGMATAGSLGVALADPATGYSFVYHLELLLLFTTLIALGPLVSSTSETARRPVAELST